MNGFNEQLRLKNKIRNGDPCLGLFVKTPSMHTVELLASVGLDFVVLDAEHAPFSIEALDSCILAGRAVGINVLVRVDGMKTHLIQSVLDMGAAGVIIPHIRSANEARQAVSATQYSKGSRGFSASHRAACYGRLPAADHRESSDESIIVLGQIEDADAVENIDEIAAVVGLDALFIGSADLSISLGVKHADDPMVEQAIDKICQSCVNAGKTIGLFLPSTEAVPQFREKGIHLFFISSDQSLLRKAATELADSFKKVTL
jgi:2-keto-3-deoxy-L-rhamnonate aldolase RhmA